MPKLEFSKCSRIKLALFATMLCDVELRAPNISANTGTTDNPIVVLETTKGLITAELFPKRAPKTTQNFIQLVNDEFYNGLIFHRVLVGFVIQTGGFDTNFNPKTSERSVPNESFNGLLNEPGSLAMARETNPDSAMAQFFINMNSNMHLDAQPGVPGYTVFGKVINGYEIAEQIELSDTQLTQGMVGVPVVPIQIIKAYMHQ